MIRASIFFLLICCYSALIAQPFSSNITNRIDRQAKQDYEWIKFTGLKLMEWLNEEAGPEEIQKLKSRQNKSFYERKIQSGRDSVLFFLNPNEHDFEITDFSQWYTYTDTVLWVVIDSNKCGEIPLNGVYTDALFAFDLQNLKFRSKAFIEGGFFKSCKNLEFLCPDLNVNQLLVFENVHFSGGFQMGIQGKCRQVIFKNCTFDNNSIFISVPESCILNFDNCNFSDTPEMKINIEKFSKSVYHKDFLFSSIRNVDSVYNSKYITYNWEISAESNKGAVYKRNMIVLHQVIEIFKNQHLYDEADSVYRVTKNLETLLYKYEFSRMPWSGHSAEKFRTGLYYNFNTFMGWFCGYGTLPVDSFLKSIYIIVFFALFYVLFPTPMREDKGFLNFEHIYFLLSFFSGEQTVLNDFMREYRDFKEKNPGNKLKKFIESLSLERIESFRENLPPGLGFYLSVFVNSYKRKNIFLRGILFFYTVQIRTRISAIEFMEKVAERKLKKNPGKTEFTMKDLFDPIIAGPGILFFFGLILARIPQSLLISINSFSTLGFGQLPLSGVTRYIAIIEGLIGWFTLSLFSITYVNILLR